MGLAAALLAALVVLVTVGESQGDFSLGRIPVYHVSAQVYWRELESVQLDQARQGGRQ